MATNIKSVFDGFSHNLKVDKTLMKNIHAYNQAFINKTDDHIEFFGGNLLGVQTVRFMSSDKNDWIDGLLHLDEYKVRQAVTALPTIKSDWVRATDVVNLSCVYLVHRIFNSDLSHEDKQQCMIDTLMVMHFRLFGSLLAYYFRYPADESTALATYAALSKKFLIKQHGNWNAVLKARCQDIISDDSIHYQTIKKFDDDAAIVYMITDIQGRLREMVKKIWRVFDIVRTQNAQILTVGGTIELDGKTVVKDVSRNYSPYRRYLNEISLDRGRFIKPELVEIIASAMHTMSEELLTQTLNYLVDHAGKDKDIEKFMDEVLLHAFEYLSTDRRAQETMGDIGSLVAKLRALYMASRSSDEAVMKIRDHGEIIVKKAVNTRNESAIAAVRTGLALYVVLRTFARNHYG